MISLSNSHEKNYESDFSQGLPVPIYKFSNFPMFGHCSPFEIELNVRIGDQTILGNEAHALRVTQLLLQQQNTFVLYRPNSVRTSLLIEELSKGSDILFHLKLPLTFR